MEEKMELICEHCKHWAGNKNPANVNSDGYARCYQLKRHSEKKAGDDPAAVVGCWIATKASFGCTEFKPIEDEKTED